jgi:hypothetical protein
MFSEAGVAIQWYGWRCPVDAIQVTISTKTARELHPGALAYALPHSGTQIMLFYDRMKQTIESYRFPSLLAHVLAHEITHLLQGFPRHSDSGLMKATWNWQDYYQMDGLSLPFTDEDIELIHRGLAQRPERSAGLR